MNQRRGSVAAVLAVYGAVSLFIGRHVLAHVSTVIGNDLGDPIFTTAILHWIGHHVPYTDAWYQLPIFYPSRDALTFSEHLLGIAVVATPIEWLTGNAVIAYNVTLVLSFALCAAAMFALAWRLTRSVPAAFVAGLAYGFAPYRISQLPHIQMEAVWWAPLALLGLHAYLETGRRRWLVLYGVAWLLQGAANGYMLVFLSVLVGVWMLWFVVAQRRWRELLAIAGSTVIAALPLAPILLRYVQVHRFYGMVRDIEDIKFFSADIAAVGCAPGLLSAWGWLRVSCRPEGELFPGAVLFLLFVAAMITVFRSETPSAPASRWVRLGSRLLLAAAVVYGAIAVSVWWLGPWSYQLGALHVTSSSIAKPVLVSVCSFVLALGLPAGVRLAARRASVTSFYVLSALLMWVLALGPRLRFMDKSIGYDGPYDFVLLLPGGDALRVPARFWIMAVLCLSAVAALFVADVIKRHPRRFANIFVALVAIGVLSDGWVNAIPIESLPPNAPNPAALAGRTVLELPMGGDYPDIAAEYRALMGGWRTINGYSGFNPTYYPLLTEAANEHSPDLFEPLQDLGELDVLVRRDAVEDEALLHTLPDVRKIAEDDNFVQFRLPATRHRQHGTGQRVPIAVLSSPCSPVAIERANDHNTSTEWICGPGTASQEVRVDLGHEQDVGGIVYDAIFSKDVPRQLVIETSLDGVSWMAARQGSAWGAAISAAMRNEKSLPMWFPFEPRRARYVRLSRPAQTEEYYWRISELEVWTR